MNRYLVKLVYQIICGDGQHTAQFDEQLRLVKALGEHAALQKACAIGRQEEEVFINKKQQMVQWKFINAAELYALDELGDGAEVFSQIKEPGDAQDYCRFVHHKGAKLHASFNPQTV